MSILVSGSLALDHIMVFPDRFKEHILPDKLHILNVSFNIQSLETHFGGVAGNIGYHHIHHLVVTDDYKVVGVLSSFDLLKLVAENPENDTAPQPAGDRGARRGFLTILRMASDRYRGNPDDIARAAADLTRTLERRWPGGGLR